MAGLSDLPSRGKRTAPMFAIEDYPGPSGDEPDKEGAPPSRSDESMTQPTSDPQPKVKEGE